MSLRTFAVLCAGALASFLASPAAPAADHTVVGPATLAALSSRWILVQTPVAGDADRDGHTLFEIGPTPDGPFTTGPAHWGRMTGDSEWRDDAFGRDLISPATTYYVRATTFDPDGVEGANPQVLGPVVTPALDVNAVSAVGAKAEARRDEIMVVVPIADDSNANSGGTVEIATSPDGPWTRRCGSPSESNLPFALKRCRLRGLQPATDYWLRVTLTDPDGVVGENPQVIGPITYDGLANLALQRPITADPGWGCCPDPSHLVDGRIQNDAWYFGFAWTGGLGGWAGGPPGWKQATVDLGAGTTLNRAIVWYHDPAAVPTAWTFQVSDDGAAWTDVYAETQPVCRTADVALPGAWYHPACAHDAVFAEVTTRYLRYWFDDRTLFNGSHGWAVEIEAFDDLTPANPATEDAETERRALTR